MYRGFYLGLDARYHASGESPGRTRFLPIIKGLKLNPNVNHSHHSRYSNLFVCRNPKTRVELHAGM